MSHAQRTAKRITTALIPAAGMGKRLYPRTRHCPKCLVNVHDKPLLQHAIDALEANGYKRLVIITGHRHRQIASYIQSCDTRMDIHAVYNDRFKTTNNIYSLWLSGQWIREPFLLLESDLIFDPEAIASLSRPDTIALDRFDPCIHNGTTATITSRNQLASLNLSNGTCCSNSTFNSNFYKTGLCKTEHYKTAIYKTVNMYSFSQATWNKVHQALKSRLDEGHVHAYYELAIRDLVRTGQIKLEMADFSNHWWDEIDCIEDLTRVEQHMKRRNRLLTHPDASMYRVNRPGSGLLQNKAFATNP